MNETVLPLLSVPQAQALLDCANDPAFFLDGMKVVDCNALARQWFGCLREAMVGSSVLHWSTQLQAEAEPSSQWFDKQIGTAISLGFVRFGWMFQREDGAEKYARVSLRPVMLDNGARYLFCTIHDASEMKALSDQTTRHIDRFRLMFDASPSPLWLLRSNVFIGCNRAAVKILGYASRKELLNKHPSDLSPPVQPDGQDSRAKANLMGKLAYKNGVHQFEWVHRRANGEEFHAEVILTPIEIDLGSVMLCAWRDITVQRQREMSLMATIKKLEDQIAALKSGLPNSATPTPP
jgi:PAS domain S-box-containing protein